MGIIEKKYYEAMNWIYNHCINETEYAFVLSEMHWTVPEIYNELSTECGLSDNEINEIIEFLNL